MAIDVKALLEELKVEPKEIKDLEGAVTKAKFNLSKPLAKELFVKFWSLRATTSEWLTRAKRVELEAKAEVERMLMALKSASQATSEAAKDREAKDDPKYHAVVDRLSTATLVREFLMMKRDDISQGHYMCKELLEDARAEMVGGQDPKKGSF